MSWRTSWRLTALARAIGTLLGPGFGVALAYGDELADVPNEG